MILENGLVCDMTHYVFQNQYCFDPLTNNNVKFFNLTFIPFLDSMGIEYDFEELDEIWRKKFPTKVRWRVYIKNESDVHLILVNFPNIFEHENNLYKMKNPIW